MKAVEFADSNNIYIYITIYSLIFLPQFWTASYIEEVQCVCVCVVCVLRVCVLRV